MSLFLRLERRLEAIMEGMFARWARDRIHPLEIGRRVLREMDEKAVAGVGGMLLPNDYEVFLHPSDFTPYAAYTRPLVAEITDSLRARAEELGGRLGGPVCVVVAPREEIARGEIYVNARFLPAPSDAGQQTLPGAGRGPEDAQPGGSGGVPDGDTRIYRRSGSRRLRVRVGPAGLADREFLLDQPVTTIGRRSDQDIVLDDASVSRAHARIEIDAEGVAIVDLGSTNGTLVNDHAVRGVRIPLRSGDRIKIGAVLLEYLTSP